MPDGKTEIGLETSRPFHVGVRLVEPMANRVSVGDTSVQLEQKVMAVLVCLAEHAGEAVTRQQLIDWVWDEGFVADNTITHAVAELRKSLGDCARKPMFIETIHRRGYRLIAPVRFDGAQPVMSSTPHPSFLAIARGVEFPLYEGENLIGRAPDAVITIPSMKVLSSSRANHNRGRNGNARGPWQQERHVSQRHESSATSPAATAEISSASDV